MSLAELEEASKGSPVYFQPSPARGPVQPTGRPRASAGPQEGLSTTRLHKWLIGASRSWLRYVHPFGVQSRGCNMGPIAQITKLGNPALLVFRLPYL
jgi:hypothetical protein